MDRIWAPWRMNYIESSKKPGCVFCEKSQSKKDKRNLVLYRGMETFILMNQNFSLQKALKTALGMSFISMISMEIAMNLTDYALTGGAILTWWVVPIMLAVGFVTPWPYNYWRLKKHNQACH